MFGRGLTLMAALGAAVAVPYLISGGKMPSFGGGESDATASASATADGATTDFSQSGTGTSAAQGEAQAPLSGPVVTDFAEILNFNVSTAWVLGRWPRVSTRLADLNLQGYRVPLVTGTREDDLAGALTYYFNRQQRVERITFYGTTGDARRLVDTLQRYHGFERELTDDPGLYLYRVKDRRNTLSELVIRPANVVTAGQPHARFEVTLNMQRSGTSQQAGRAARGISR